MFDIHLFWEERVEDDQKSANSFRLWKAKDFSKFAFPNLVAFIVAACGGGGG